MQNAQRDLDRYGKNLQKVGAGLTLGVTAPLLGIGGLAVKAAADFETLNTSLETVFQGNSEAAKQAFKDITDFTAKTPFQLEEVASGFIKLKNLGLDPGIESLRSYGNTASALGKTLDQMVEAVADAAVGEFERLKEFGIKAKSEGENVAFTFQGVTTRVGKNSQEIQQYLLDLGNTKFAGGIEKQANTFNGQISTLKDNIKLLFADFGVILLEIIKPFVGLLQDMAARFRELSPAAKKFIVILAGIAAAVGPLLALAGTILPAIGTGFVLLSGPVGLILAGLTAIGVVIYKNWAPIKQTLVDIANYFIDLYNESFAFRIVVESIGVAFKNIFAQGKFIFGVLGEIISMVATNIKNSFIGIGEVIRAIFTGNFKAIPELLKKNFNKSTQGFKDFIAEVQKDFGGFKDSISQNISDGINNALSKEKYELIGSNVDTASLTDQVANAVTAGLVKGASGKAIEIDEFEIIDQEDIDNMIIDFGGKFEDALKLANIESFENSLKLDLEFDETALDEFVPKLSKFEERLLEFKENSAQILTDVAGNFAVGFAQVIAGMAQGTVGLGAVAGLLLSTIGDLAVQLGKAAIKIGITMKAIKLSFTNPLTAIVAGGALVILGTLLKSVSQNFAGNFANGGIVGGSSFAGDRLTAGVNSGELILNVAQQKNLAGALSSGRNITLAPSLDVDGRKLRVMLQQVDNFNGRVS